MSEAIIYKTIESEVKEVDVKGRTMIGAFTRYNVKDSDGDIARKGMFTKTWQENFKRIKHLLNHDVTKPVGQIKRLWEDEDYAYYESAVGTHKLGDDVLEMAESGLLTEHSYGYTVLKKNNLKTGRELLEVKQWEISNLSGWGANEYSPLLSFSKDQNKTDLETKLLKRQKGLETFCRNSTATDETIELLLLESKQLTQIILDISTQSTQPDEKQQSTLPEGIKDVITTFRKTLITN